MNVIEPLFERQFIFDSYANRVGKGTHKALDRCTYFLRRYQYVMHLDVRQFFPSIDHEILVGILSRTIGDKRVMNLAKKIIASGAGVQADGSEMVYFPGDDLFSASRPRGLPMGDLTSQHWANVYLNQLDQYAKRVLKCQAYIRYVDDVLLFAQEKRTLLDWRTEIMFSENIAIDNSRDESTVASNRFGNPIFGLPGFPHPSAYSAFKWLCFSTSSQADGP